nr:MAG TPA: zinc finger domain protein [Caudoviricetes sp.]
MATLKCKFCSKVFNDPDAMAAHLENYHADMIPPDMEPYQFYYYLKTGKTHGNCVMCKQPTGWNPKTKKYKRFCENPKCKIAYRNMFKTRMIGTYGKVTLLNDPDQQKKMLANRSISGLYEWSDHSKKLPYTGSYELSFLKFLDEVMDFDSSDVMAPSPHTYNYMYEGKQHFYIPDFFIPSLNLEIEIKDGGDNPNMHYKIQDVDKEKERLKDEVMRTNSSNFNYLKIVNKQNEIFFKYLELAKKKFAANDNTPIFMV